MKRTKGDTQIIILEHASFNVWFGILNINFMPKWRGEEKTKEYKALLPSEWLISE
jgi:hypothetical protein